MEQQDLNKRLLLALALSFFVFVGYSYFFPVEKTATQENQTVATSAHQTPSVTTQSKSAPAPASTASNAVVSAAPVQNATPSIATVTSEHYKMTIDELGRIAQVELLEKKYQTEEGINLQMLGQDQVKPLEVRFADPKVNEEAFKIPYVNAGAKILTVTEGASQVLTLTQTLSTLTVTKTITFMSSGAYDVTVKTSTPTSYFLTPGHRPMADTSVYMLVRGVLVKGADDIITTIEDEDAEGYEKFESAKIASAFDRYVASLFFDFDKGLTVSVLKEANGDPLLFVEGKDTLSVHA